jgi:hypothetical protein
MISVARLSRFIHVFLTTGETYNKGRLLVCHWLQEQTRTRGIYEGNCAADFSLLNLPKGKSLGRSKPATNS